jgi:hypothetical protein
LLGEFSISVQLRRCKLKTVVLAARDGYGHAITGQRHIRIGDPVRRGNDDLVARLNGGRQGAVDRALCAVGHDDFVGVVGQAVLTLQLGGDRLPQLDGSLHRRVAGCARFHGPGSRLADVRRRVKIGLADDQIDDLLALPPQLIGTVGGRGARRRLDTSDARCDSEGIHEKHLDSGTRHDS